MRSFRFEPPHDGTPLHWKQPPNVESPWLSTAARMVAALLAGSGALNLLSLIGGPAPAAMPAGLFLLFPLDFAGIPPTLTLVSGFAMILVAVHLWSYKRRAWQIAIALAAASALIHLLPFRRYGWNPGEASGSALLCAVLWPSRRLFNVGSEPPRAGVALKRALFAFAVAGIYGAAGFWLLEPVEFHRNFHWWEAAARTIRLMLFLGDPSLVPQTPYAGWFLDSLFWMSGAAMFYSGVVLFHPVVYRFRVNLANSTLAQSIAERYGRSGQDFFKHGRDKSYFFSTSRRSFLGYRVAGHYALALGDPVGPEADVRPIVVEFRDFCRTHGWRVGFYQVSGEHLQLYDSLGFQRMKIGDDALVDLSAFSLSGSAKKEFRNTVNRLDRLGYRVERIDPPLADSLLTDLKRISDDWLRIPGHRERQFTLGQFEPEYVRRTTVYVAFDPSGRPAAFLNLVPPYDPTIATVDLMRRVPFHINGLMDYLFAKVFLDLKARGIEWFNLGMAPLSDRDATNRVQLDEKAAHWVMKRLPFLFRADSLRRFKAKYADSWQPRYAVYQNSLDLPRLALALRKITEIPPETAARQVGRAA